MTQQNKVQIATIEALSSIINTPIGEKQKHRTFSKGNKELIAKTVESLDSLIAKYEDKADEFKEIKKKYKKDKLTLEQLSKEVVNTIIDRLVGLVYEPVNFQSLLKMDDYIQTQAMFAGGIEEELKAMLLEKGLGYSVADVNDAVDRAFTDIGVGTDNKIVAGLTVNELLLGRKILEGTDGHDSLFKMSASEMLDYLRNTYRLPKLPAIA